MTDGPGIGGDGDRFTPRTRRDATFSNAASPRHRVFASLADMEQRLAWAQEIVDAGQEAFFREGNWQPREAMKSILVDLNTAADRLPRAFASGIPRCHGARSGTSAMSCHTTMRASAMKRSGRRLSRNCPVRSQLRAILKDYTE